MGENHSAVLVVDDDVAVARVICAQLAQAGYRATTVDNAATALELLGRGGADLLLSDIRMPGMDGMQLLKAAREKWPDVPVVLMTAHGTIQLAVEAMKFGAADFVAKPFEREELLAVVARTLDLAAPARARVPSHRAGTTLSEMVGESPAMAEVTQLIRQAAPSNATVLVLGENGTGKELAARAVHDLSPRAKKPFVAVSCGALPESLIEAELFGYEKGAFTGAGTTKPGRFEFAEGGTFFLDEVGDIPPATQVKLLRVLQQKEFERLGGTKTLKADVRMVAATNRNLEELVAQGKFREDLYHRLAVVPLWLPPLRDRKGDVPLLARHFLAQFARSNGRGTVALADDAVALLEAQRWPGNVRQLQNFMERLVVLTPGEVVTARDVQRELDRGPKGPPSTATQPAPQGQATLDGARRQAECAALQDAIKQAGGNRTLAARMLGISRRTLYNKLEECSLA